jgi:hypothetical protein
MERRDLLRSLSAGRMAAAGSGLLAGTAGAAPQARPAAAALAALLLLWIGVAGATR